MIKYRFFDYKYNIEGFTSDLFSTTHIVFIVLALLSVIAIGIFAHKFDKKKITWFLRGLAIFVTLLEASKIIWESYYDITTGRGFNAGGILPFYSCSLLIYCLWFGAWGKGKPREIALTWLGTIGLCCGLIGTIYTNGLNWYPFWTYGAWDSILFHYNLLMVGVLLLSSGYIKLRWKDILLALVPMVLLSVIASPINYYYGGDYMQIYSGDGVPLMNDLASYLNEKNLRPLFTYIMLASYSILSGSVVAISKLIDLIKKTSHSSSFSGS
ncbi:MAG: YwaF family protein, partial [Clostridia bacterium]|nr:YwaF family protein [Clostridia bacterium]